jgi:hypothetical protein
VPATRDHRPVGAHVTATSILAAHRPRAGDVRLAPLRRSTESISSLIAGRAPVDLPRAGFAEMRGEWRRSRRGRRSVCATRRRRPAGEAQTRSPSRRRRIRPDSARQAALASGRPARDDGRRSPTNGTRRRRADPGHPRVCLAQIAASGCLSFSTAATLPDGTSAPPAAASSTSRTRRLHRSEAARGRRPTSVELSSCTHGSSSQAISAARSQVRMAEHPAAASRRRPESSAHRSSSSFPSSQAPAHRRPSRAAAVDAPIDDDAEPRPSGASSETSSKVRREP